MKSFLVYKFTFGSCSSSYIGETCRHFKTRIEEHIFKHQHSTATCFDSYNSLCFKIIDKVNSKFDLKIKEALHISWRKRNFKRTTKSFSSHPFTVASAPPPPPSLVLFCLYFFAFLFHLLLLLPLTLIGIIYCFNYTSLLLHLVTTHLLLHPFPSSIFFITPELIIGIFYCLNYTSLLLYLIITHLVEDFIITM